MHTYVFIGISVTLLVVAFVVYHYVERLRLSAGGLRQMLVMGLSAAVMFTAMVNIDPTIYLSKGAPVMFPFWMLVIGAAGLVFVAAAVRALWLPDGDGPGSAGDDGEA